MGLRMYGRSITSILALLAGGETALGFAWPAGANWLWLYCLQRQNLNQELSCPRQAAGLRREPAPWPSEHSNLPFKGSESQWREQQIKVS